MKKAIVTGAAGFAGTALVERLIKRGTEVCAVVRPESSHNDRLLGSDGNIYIIECDIKCYSQLIEKINNEYDIFYHLAWVGDRNSSIQYDNIQYTLDALNVASQLGCKRFIATGSQAEYGVVPFDEVIYESRNPNPFSPYGAAKVAACYASRQKAKDEGIEWIWGRIFSLIGKYEPRGRMLPDLYASLKEGMSFKLSSCRQNWDYLDVFDAADALIALAERGRDGEIYNIASGKWHRLSLFTDRVQKIVGAKKGSVLYGDDSDMMVSLQPSIEKIHKDTGWTPTIEFDDSVREYEQYYK